MVELEGVKEDEADLVFAADLWAGEQTPQLADNFAVVLLTRNLLLRLRYVEKVVHIDHAGHFANNCHVLPNKPHMQ